MNIRQLLHAISAVAAAIAAGAVSQPIGLSPEAGSLVVFVSAMLALFINTYLGGSTSGLSAAEVSKLGKPGDN